MVNHLPLISTLAELSVSGTAFSLLGQVRPGWKVLRRLGERNHLSSVPTHYRGLAWICAGPPFVLPPWLLLPVQWWGYSTVSICQPPWPPGQWKNHSMPDWPLLMDILPPPKTELCQVISYTWVLYGHWRYCGGTSHSVQNLSVTLDDHLDFKKHIACTTQHCRHV